MQPSTTYTLNKHININERLRPSYRGRSVVSYPVVHRTLIAIQRGSASKNRDRNSKVRQSSH